MACLGRFAPQERGNQIKPFPWFEEMGKGERLDMVHLRVVQLGAHKVFVDTVTVTPFFTYLYVKFQR
jgi:hypothetical protein